MLYGRNSLTGQDLIDATREFIPHVLRMEHVPGLNLAVALKGEIIWEEGFGYADLAKKTPMTPQTVMRSGSMGKTYTATAVMQLVERDIVELQTPVNEYLDFKLVNPLGDREITAYDLLTHHSGLTVNSAHSTFQTPKSLAEHLRETFAGEFSESFDGRTAPLWSTKVGAHFAYSNLGMAVLGYIVELMNPDGLSFSDYQQTYIIDPLGMTSTQYPPVQSEAHVRPDVFERVSTGYAMFGPIRIPTPDIFFADFPAGGIVTTPGDHIRVLLAYLGEGRFNGYQLLRSETVKQILTPQTDRGPEATSSKLGLTWGLYNYGTPNFYFGHGGAHMYGWHNDYRAYPELGLAMCIAVNEWPMLKTRYATHNLIANFLTSWLQHEGRTGARRPAASWAWKASYAAGLQMVRQIRAIGINEPISAEMIETMATGADIRLEGENGERLWDAEGFQAGAFDMLKVENTPSAVRAFMSSDELRISPGEARLLHLELGA